MYTSRYNAHLLTLGAVEMTIKIFLFFQQQYVFHIIDNITNYDNR